MREDGGKHSNLPELTNAKGQKKSFVYNENGVMVRLPDSRNHNLYGYCGNNPVMYVDGSGYARLWWNGAYNSYIAEV